MTKSVRPSRCNRSSKNDARACGSCKKAKDAGAKGGITVGGANAWGVLPYFWSLGGKLTNEDYTKIDGFVNSPESVKALEQIIQWKKTVF